MNKIVLNPVANKNLDALFEQYNDKTIFYFQPGQYELTQQLNVTKPNVRFIGLTHDPKDVHILQKTPEQNGISVEANNFVLNYISLHVEEGSGVCLSHANCNWSAIENNHFYGSDTNFTVYFAGPQLTAGEGTINGFLNDVLDYNNVFDNNIIYTKWNGDSVSFSLQKYGSFRDNIIRGGKVAIYMVKDCVVTNNNISDSSSNGIYCSLPCHNIEISYNRISNPVSGAISVKQQIEHGEFSNENHNININNNLCLNPQHIGIELNNAHNININNNLVLNTPTFAFYALNSEQVNLDNNIFVKFKRGVNIEMGCKDINVTNAKFYSVFPNISEHAIAVTGEDGTPTSNITGDNISVSGKYISVVVKDNSDSVFSNLQHNEYHDYTEEFLQLNLV